MSNTYMNADLFANLTLEVQQMRKHYGVHTLEHVPEQEISGLSEAWAGDLVRKGKHVGIVFDVKNCGGMEALAIVLNSGRVITHTRKPL